MQYIIFPVLFPYLFSTSSPVAVDAIRWLTVSPIFTVNGMTVDILEKYLEANRPTFNGPKSSAGIYPGIGLRCRDVGWMWWGHSLEQPGQAEWVTRGEQQQFAGKPREEEEEIAPRGRWGNAERIFSLSAKNFSSSTHTSSTRWRRTTTGAYSMIPCQFGGCPPTAKSWPEHSTISPFPKSSCLVCRSMRSLCAGLYSCLSWCGPISKTAR